MFHERIPGKQLSAWLFAAIVPVILQQIGGSWIWALCLGGLGIVIASVLWRKPREPGKTECAILLLYITILLGQLLAYTAQSWPVGNSDPAVPLILMALAVWSSQRGLSASARVGAVLYWAVLGLYFVVCISGVKNVKFEWLRPEMTGVSAIIPILFMLPGASSILLGKKGSPGIKGVLIVVFATMGAAVTAGILSPAMASKLPNSFYEMGRSQDLLGVARRFEALICAGTTVGWFSLISLLLTLCGTYAEKISSGKGKAGVLLAAIAAAGSKLCGLHITDEYLLLTGTVFWVVIPLLTQGLGREKKS